MQVLLEFVQVFLGFHIVNKTGALLVSSDQQVSFFMQLCKAVHELLALSFNGAKFFSKSYIVETEFPHSPSTDEREIVDELNLEVFHGFALDDSIGVVSQVVESYS